MALTSSERDDIQAVVTSVRTSLRARYGSDAVLGAFRLITDGAGTVSDLVVTVEMSIADPDGTAQGVNKSVSIW